MSSEALNQEHGAPESGERRISDSEKKDRSRNELEQALQSTEPTREISGESFLADANEYLSLSQKIEAKKQEIWNLDSKVPKGSDVSQVLAGLTSELNSFVDRRHAVVSKHGDKADIFRADVEALGERRAKIADRKAKIERFTQLAEQNKAAGKDDATSAPLAGGLRKELQKLEAAYPGFEAEIMSLYDDPSADHGKRDIENFQIDTLLGETDKEIESALSALDEKNLLPDVPPPMPGRKADMPPMPRGDVSREDLGTTPVLERDIKTTLDLKPQAETVPTPAAEEQVEELSADDVEDITEEPSSIEVDVDMSGMKRANRDAKGGAAEFEEVSPSAEEVQREAMEAVFKRKVGQHPVVYLEGLLKSQYGIDNADAALAKRGAKGSLKRRMGDMFGGKSELLDRYEAAVATHGYPEKAAPVAEPDWDALRKQGEFVRGAAMRLKHELNDKFGITDPDKTLEDRSAKGFMGRLAYSMGFGGRRSDEAEAKLAQYNELTKELSDLRAMQNEEEIRGSELYKQSMAARGSQGTRMSSGEGRNVERK